MGIVTHLNGGGIGSFNSGSQRGSPSKLLGTGSPDMGPIKMGAVARRR